MPIELGFILHRLAEMAEADGRCATASRGRPRTSTTTRWLGDAITKHYHGDDGDVKVLMGGILQRVRRADRRDLRSRRGRVPARRQHPTLGRTFRECGYLPMVELLRYLEANGFTNYIASGGDRDFMRPVTDDIYGIPAERVIGSSNALGYQDDEHGGTLSTRRHRRVRRRPGQAGADLEPDRPPPDRRGRQLERRHPDAALRRRARRPALRLLLLHDDAEREFAYTAGAENVARAGGSADGWTVVSIKNDWATVFAEPL